MVVGLLALSALLVAAHAQAPVVNTSCGPVEGLWDRPGLAAFLGIPFAQPPVGRLRWMPPRDAPCWGPSTYMAKEQPFACPQLNLGFSGNQSEDCLYLNVFSTLPKEPVPVLVWIYGGGSVDGSTSGYGEIQNIISSLNNQVVLVAFNYRLNSFGYFALHELSEIDPRGTSGNYGILDCQKALQWVQRHIASFGGDPSKVGVFGQSSGGTQVLGLLASPGSRGLFSAAISLSGSPNITMLLPVMEHQGKQLVDAAGCTNAPNVLDCLYALDMEAILKATPQHWSYEGSFRVDTITPRGTGLYPGLVVVDGATITMPLPQALRQGLVDVPLIISTMQCEDDNDFTETIAWNQTNFDAFCNLQFSLWPAAVAPTVERLYDTMASVNAAFAYYNLASDACVTCGNAAITVAAGQGYKSPVYLAVNTHWPSHGVGTSNQRLFPYHTWDTTCAFETWGDKSQGDGGPFIPQPSDIAYGANLRRLWLELTRDGKLSSECLPVNEAQGFPASYNTVLLADTVVTALNFKTTMCSTLYNLGFDEKFWWVN